MQYRELNASEIYAGTFHCFDRYQEVTQCWRKVNGEWVIRDIAYIESWNEADFEALAARLRRTVETSGVVIGAFTDGLLKGFASVEGHRFGSNSEYLDLTNVHVSCDARGAGIGKELLHLAAVWARAHGAKKLYISAHSSVESQAFYKAMGCIEAAEYDPEHVANEPCDCQMEYDLTQ